MDLLVVASDDTELSPVINAAHASGCSVVETISTLVQAIDSDKELFSRIRNTSFDVMVYVSREIKREDLRVMNMLGGECPRPVLLLTEDTRDHSIDAAMRAGAAGYVAGCTNMKRLYSLCQVAMARFIRQREMKEELDNARYALQQRKVIEKAKGIIMKQRNLNEEEAYSALRKLAMDTNSRIHDVANQVINAAQLLI